MYQYLNTLILCKKLLTICPEDRERPRASLLDIFRASSSREGGRLVDGGLCGRDEVGAIDKVPRVVADDCKLLHSALEVVHHKLLVVDHALPFARSAVVTCESEVGLETHLAFSRKGRVDLGTVGVVNAEGNTGALKEDFKEDLGVEGEGSSVERNSLVSGYEGIRTGDRVRREKVDELCRREATVLHTSKDAIDAVLRLRNGSILCREGCVRASGQELETGGTSAVSDTDGSGELDKISGGDKVLLEKRGEGVDRVVDTVVGREVGLDFVEDDHRPVSSSTLQLAALGEADGVVESKTERLVNVFTALAVEDLLKIITEREEWATL